MTHISHKPYNDLHMTSHMWVDVPVRVVALVNVVMTNEVYEDDVAYKVKHPNVSDFGDPFVHLVKLVGWQHYVDDGNTRVAAAKRRGDDYIAARVLKLS